MFQPLPDLETRRDVWAALSELFLDTDVTLSEEFVVRALAASPYDLPTLERILEREVAPVCIWNVFWWEWGGFDPDWLADAIQRQLQRPSLLRRLSWLPFPGRHGFGPRGYWRRVKGLVEATRHSR